MIGVGSWGRCRRNFYDSKESDPARAHFVLANIRQLYELEAEAKNIVSVRLTASPRQHRGWLTWGCTYEEDYNHRKANRFCQLRQFAESGDSSSRLRENPFQVIGDISMRIPKSTRRSSSLAENSRVM